MYTQHKNRNLHLSICLGFLKNPTTLLSLNKKLHNTRAPIMLDIHLAMRTTQLAKWAWPC